MSVNPGEYNEEWRDALWTPDDDGPRYAGGIMIVGDKEDARGD